MGLFIGLRKRFLFRFFCLFGTRVPQGGYTCGYYRILTTSTIDSVPHGQYHFRLCSSRSIQRECCHSIAGFSLNFVETCRLFISFKPTRNRGFTTRARHRELMHISDTKRVCTAQSWCNDRTGLRKRGVYEKSHPAVSRGATEHFCALDTKISTSHPKRHFKGINLRNPTEPVRPCPKTTKFYSQILLTNR